MNRGVLEEGVEVLRKFTLREVPRKPVWVLIGQGEVSRNVSG